MFRKLILITGLLSGLSFCSANKFIVNQAADFMESGKAAFEKEPDLDIAETALASNLKLTEALLQKDPENLKLRIFLSQGYSLYSMAFVEDRYEEYSWKDENESQRQKKRAILFYNRARDYASLNILKKMNIRQVNQINKNILENFLKNETQSDVPELFWFAFSWGSSINLQRDNIIELASLPYIVMIMEKVKELNPDFYFGGVYLFEGMYFGGRPEMLGGNMEKSEKAFETARTKTSGKLLLVPYFKAATYCIQTQNSSCFKENLEYVIEAKEDIFPEQRLANSLAKRKAERLLKHYDDYFLEDN